MSIACLPHRRLVLLLASALLAFLLGACASDSAPTPAPGVTATPFPAAAGPTATPALDQGQVLLTVRDGTEARYRVREQLARVNFPSDAVGVTSDVEGSILLEAESRVIAEGSRLTADLRTLVSDESRRDNYLRNNTLETNLHPMAVFVPREVRGLEGPLPETGEASFLLVGDLTLRDVTREVVWDVTATFTPDTVTGEAATSFTFGDFEMSVPRVAIVLSVEDNIRLELDFLLDRAG